MKKTMSLTYTFINPNSPAVFEQTLKKILLDKLLSDFAYPEHLQATG